MSTLLIREERNVMVKNHECEWNQVRDRIQAAHDELVAAGCSTVYMHYATWPGLYNNSFGLYGHRAQTEAEAEAKRRHDANVKELLDSRERIEYERLKAKFEPKE